MTVLADTLDALGDALAATVADAVDGRVLHGFAEGDVVAVMAAAARVGRLVEAVLVDAAGVVIDRSSSALAAERMTTRLGCRSVDEVLQRVTRGSRRSCTDVVAAAGAVSQETSLTTGEVLPATLPGMRAALICGEVGVDGVVAVAHPLRGLPGGLSGVLVADEELSAAATGTGPDGGPACTADELRAQAMVWAAFLDPDGAAPVEVRALRKRGLSIGVCRDGVVPIRGNLLPEVAGQLQRELDALLNPKVDGVVAPEGGVRFVEQGAEGDAGVDGVDYRVDGEAYAPTGDTADLRSRVQRQHDAFAVILNKAVDAMPTLGGAAPVLVVSVREDDLAEDTGYAHISGVGEPVSLRTARHVACTGVIERVTSTTGGRVVSMTTTDRVFTRHQRRALLVRDGGCVIPGCHIPAEWCEVHHIHEHAKGGPTSTDNGVLLCWFHHRTLDTSGWLIRVRDGVPEIRGPYWWDPHLRWRPATKSPTRKRTHLNQRT